MKRANRIMIFAAALMLSACGALNLATPKSFGERVVAAYETTSAVRDTAYVLLDNGKISYIDASHVQRGADNVREGIDVARELHSELESAGEEKLDQALATLRVLQKYVNERSK